MLKFENIIKTNVIIFSLSTLEILLQDPTIQSYCRFL